MRNPVVSPVPSGKRSTYPAIPFQRADLGGAEIQALTEAVRFGQLGGNGPVCRCVEERLAEITGAKHVLLTPNATQAIELYLAGVGIGPGDEVLMPSFAFVTLATAVCARGATPVFCDLDPKTLNIDPADVERRITPRSRLIVPMHYAGVSCDLDRLLALAKSYKLPVFEDAAQGLNASWKGRHLGTLGDAGVLSFHSTKNISCGEGGALVTNNTALVQDLELRREKGTDRSAYLRGEVDRYTWRGPGGNYALSDLLAAILDSQLNRLEEIQKKRSHLWSIYHKLFEESEAAGWIRRPSVPSYARHNAHLYVLRTRTAKAQEQLLRGLRMEGIGATFHFQPLHKSPYARDVLKLEQSLPQTELAAETLVRLPLSSVMTEEDAFRVAEVTRRLLGRGGL